MSAGDKSYGGRYALIERIGSGGMSEVYRARDDLLGRDVAVKVLSERLSGDRAFVERFKREAQAAANLNHPNIVSLYDYGTDDGANYIVMEYIDGKSLSDVIAAEGPLMPERAAEIASEVAQALERAHRAGIVHRDIKPANIMLTSGGQTKVTDFGIARALDRSSEQTVTQTGMVMGTASYLSPEQAQGDPVDARSDIYSLGCVLYEMLTGRPPFTGETPLAIAYKHVRENASPPSRSNPDAPRSLDAVALKALAKAPNHRYPSAAEMHEDLQRFLQGRRVLAAPVPDAATTVAAAVPRGTEMMRGTDLEEAEPRKSLRYVLITLVALALLALLAWFFADELIGKPVKVPDLVGRNVLRAEDILEARGLKAEIVERPSDEPINTVFRQDPEAGETVEEGGSVTLFVSTGPRKTEVPTLIGLSRERAERLLRRADLELGEVQESFSDEEPGTVLDQEPDPGDEVDEGTEVDLVVSSGPELVTVPFVERQTEADAVAEIEAAGLVADVRREPSDEAEEGIVFAQDPDGGSEVESGDEVVIVVSEGPEPREMPDVTGEDADTAEQVLEDEYGLEVQQEPSEPCDSGPGTVCDQEPAPGTEVRPGDDATLFVYPEGDASVELFAFLGIFGAWA